MENITLNLVEQSVLSQVLEEISKFTNIKVQTFKSFYDLKSNLEKNSTNICITNLESYDLIKENKINNSVIYIKTSNNSDNENFKNIEIINTPLRIRNLIEKIKLIYLKNQFLDNSKVNLLNYKINLNNREITKDNKKLKLTEREVDLLLFLKNSKNPQSINNILESVWGYSKGLETHTIETHVHRLRKKFLNSFEENNLIKNNKRGYFI
tara:strand:- start:517 stop:1146 length:630 start_codon:yes stop_codon:yes gene_type:complete